MPLQNLLVSEAHQRLMRSGQPDVVPMQAGQIVGRITEVRPVADVMATLIQETARPSAGCDDDAMKIAVSAGYWGAGPPPGAATYSKPPNVSGSTRSGRPKPTAATPGPRWPGGIAHLTGPPGHGRLPAVRPAAGHPGDDRDDHGPPHPGAGPARRRHQQPAGRRGLVRQPYPRPLERTREYINIVRQVIARREPVSYDGKHYQIPLQAKGDREGAGLGKPLRSILHPYRTEIPIYLGAEGPRNVALAAESPTAGTRSSSRPR